METCLSNTELRQLQLSELSIVDELSRICTKHGLRYFLTAGTLLGAVRHQGFIPWDDDMDIAMPRQDYDRLAQIIQTELDGEFFFQSSDTDGNFPYLFSKIRKNGTEVYEPHLKKISMHKGHYIDIFPLDVCPKSNAAATVYFKAVELLTCAYVAKVDEDFVCGYKKPYMRLLFRFFAAFPLDRIRKLRERTARLPARLCSPGRLCTVGGAHGYPAETYQDGWFAEAVTLPFENRSFPAPVGWDALLTNMYGDYMQPPDEEDRTGHFAETVSERV